MNDVWQLEWMDVKRRIHQLEIQLQQKIPPVRVDKVEYRIENLIVENVDQGTLDLGVHLGNEAGRALGKGDESTNLDCELEQLKKRIDRLEIQMQEFERRILRLRQGIEYLEGLHL